MRQKNKQPPMCRVSKQHLEDAYLEKQRDMKKESQTGIQSHKEKETGKQTTSRPERGKDITSSQPMCIHHLNSLLRNFTGYQ